MIEKRSHINVGTSLTIPAGTEVGVFTDAACTVAATIYANDGVTPAANPVIVDASGEFSYRAANGTYWEKVGTEPAAELRFDDGSEYAPALGADDNYVTDAEKAALHTPGSDNQTAADIGLGNVDNTSDANKPVSIAQAAADAGVLVAANSYADGLVVGLVDDRGNYDASGNVFPSSGGSGAAGVILKGDLWTVNVAGTLGGHLVTVGDLVRALIDDPGSTDANWAITENNLGYVAENSANKDASGGYAGLTAFKINLVNALGTITSFFTTAATVARTWTMPDKDGTVAMTSDITGTNSGVNTGDQDLEVTYAFAGDLTVGVGTLRRYILSARTFKTIDASVGTAPSGGPVTALVKNSSAVTINTITIAAGTNRQSQTGLSLALEAGDYLTIDRTSVNGAADLTIILRG